MRDADVVMMLRLQRERMTGSLLPSAHEYYQLYGLTEERLSTAKPDAIMDDARAVHLCLDRARTV